MQKSMNWRWVITFAVMLILTGIGSYVLWNHERRFAALQWQLQTLRDELDMRTLPAASASPAPLQAVTTPATSVPDSSTLSQVQQLRKDLSSLTTRLAQLETKLDATPRAKTTTKSSLKEITIFLGSGSTYSRDWVAIPSAVANFDPSSYSKIKSIYFEAALSIVGGEAHARLVNLTTGGVFYSSELSNNTSVSKWSSAGPLYLQSGNNQYEVQLKSTSGEKASLDGARLHIFLE